jgi:hypothetical protein
MDISAPAISLAVRPQGALGHQCSHAPGRPILHLVSSSRRPRQVRCFDGSRHARQKKLQAAAQSLHETQTNVLAVYERNREIVELPPGLETGHTNRRKRGARTDEDCVNEVCELISRGITASAATEFVGLPWSTWHAWIRRNHCQAKEKHDLAYDFHLEAMTDKIHRVYLEIKAKREKALEAYYKRYDAWVDACNKLGKDDRLPREPQVVHAGIPVINEIGAFIPIFGIPAALAWYLAYKYDR